MQRWRVGNYHRARAVAVNLKGLPDLARYKSSLTSQRAVITTRDVVGVTFCRIPGDHAGGRRRTTGRRWRRRWFAFARAIGVDDGLNFRQRERAVEDFQFVNGSSESIINSLSDD